MDNIGLVFWGVAIPVYATIGFIFYKMGKKKGYVDGVMDGHERATEDARMAEEKYTRVPNVIDMEKPTNSD